MADIDLILWNKTKAGDKTAFELLFHKYYTVLCLFANRYTHNMEAARDVVQDLLVHLWEFRLDITIHSSLKGYLFRAVSYNSIRRMQSKSKPGIHLDLIPEMEDTDFHDHLEFAELQDNIMHSIESLPGQCRKIFMLSRFEQLKYAEIAAQLGLSVKTIENQISKALKLIQEKLDYILILSLPFIC